MVAWLLFALFVVAYFVFGKMGEQQDKPRSDGKQNKSRRFYAISDKYKSLDDVRKSLRANGLESSELIVGVDFTKSNEWSGQHSFGGRSLHTVEALRMNPYQEVLRVIAETLSAFDDDQYIPCYGFGDHSSRDKALFSFLPKEIPCHGLQEVEERYRNIATEVTLSGPTSFAPLIYKAIEIVRQNNWTYHILLIVADGQVTNEQETVDAIVAASHYPLSIVMVGVGDGPWDMMEEFDDKLPQRQFDNFQFVNFHQVMLEASSTHANQQAAFALHALMELPEQYKLIRQLGLLSPETAPQLLPTRSRVRVLDPPDYAGTEGSMSQEGGFEAARTTAEAIPAEFFCPITHEIFEDPVIANDGFTYERAAIQDWFDSGHRVSPMSNQPLENITVLPNHNLRSQINSWQTSGQVPR